MLYFYCGKSNSYQCFRRRNILGEPRDPTLLTPNRASIVEEKQLAIWKKLNSFRELQHIYVPGALRAMECKEELRSSLDLPPQEA